jgi:hypothetical protein
VVIFCMLTGFLSTLALYIAAKTFSKSRWVNPSSFGSGLQAPYVPLIFFAFFVTAFISIPLLQALEQTKGVPSFSSNPVAALLVIALGCGTSLLLGLILVWRRLGKVTPSKLELGYCEAVLRPLLLEIPANVRCRVEFNPFSAIWGSVTEAATRSIKERLVDTILRAQLPIAPTQILSIALVRAAKRRGHRKFKGYKHKVKLSLRLSSAELGNVSPAAVRDHWRVVAKGIPPLELSSSEASKFVISEATPTTVQLDAEQETISFSETFLADSFRTSDVIEDCLPHPEMVLRRVKQLTTVAYEIESSRKRAKA